MSYLDAVLARASMPARAALGELLPRPTPRFEPDRQQDLVEEPAVERFATARTEPNAILSEERSSRPVERHAGAPSREIGQAPAAAQPAPNTPASPPPRAESPSPSISPPGRSFLPQPSPVEEPRSHQSTTVDERVDRPSSPAQAPRVAPETISAVPDARNTPLDRPEPHPTLDHDVEAARPSKTPSRRPVEPLEAEPTPLAAPSPALRGELRVAQVTARPSPPERLADPTPTVTVTIGRIEIRNEAPAPAPPTPRTLPAPSPALSLDAYLRQRNRG